MPRNDFVIDDKRSAPVPENIKKIIESLINEGSKENDVFVLKNEKLDLLFCLVRWNTDLFNQAYKEKDNGILDYRGHVYLKSVSDPAKGAGFSYWHVVPNKNSDVVSIAIEKTKSY